MVKFAFLTPVLPPNPGGTPPIWSPIWSYLDQIESDRFELWTGDLYGCFTPIYERESILQRWCLWSFEKSSKKTNFPPIFPLFHLPLSLPKATYTPALSGHPLPPHVHTRRLADTSTTRIGLDRSTNTCSCPLAYLSCTNTCQDLPPYSIKWKYTSLKCIHTSKRCIHTFKTHIGESTWGIIL